MNISNYYWYFSGVLTPKFCDDVIEYAKSQKEVMARTGGYGDRKLKKEEVLDLKRKRNLVLLKQPTVFCGEISKEKNTHILTSTKRELRSTRSRACEQPACLAWP